jgi:heavy metal translocating P-type ATPase
VKKIFYVGSQVEFRLPLLTLTLVALGLASGFPFFYILAIAIGLFGLGVDSAKKLWVKQFSLDYIAILAMVVSLATNELLAGAVISLMILVSEALEAYGSREAEAALKNLVEKIPKTCQVRTEGGIAQRKIQDVREGDVIFIRQEEIIPLDGRLLSEHALMDESNLTGELEPQDYRKNQALKSGLVNAGPSIELRVSGDFSTSTYQKIVDLVRETKRHPARIVRLAERYNYGFTAITLVVAGGAYLISRDPTRLLAVLVIATPCPLLIAAPVSFLGGLNRASIKNVIIKRPAALEMLSKITTIFFDKTGTLTLGVPMLRAVEVLDKSFSQENLLAIAAAIEIHSLHPIAKAIVRATNERNIRAEETTQMRETIGAGVTGTVRGATYRLKKSTNPASSGIVIDMIAEKDGHTIGRFILDDVIKPGTTELLKKLSLRYKVAILTGDTKENATRLFGHDGIVIHARCLPGDKSRIVKAEQASGARVMMVGDGLNDAPALALADVGVVFSGTENSASIDAASVAILSRDVALVGFTLALAEKSTHIAKQSILWGIGLSVVGMVFAALGFIPPVTGAILQEGIDVAVILNALRAA